jgi:hypothetical protein
MIYLHEVHEIAGGKLEEFEAAMRERWKPLIERDDRARLLWFWEHGHGTGPSYQAVSITAIRGWEAWGEIVRRSVDDAEWRAWHRDAAAWRHEVAGRLLLSVPWSPLEGTDGGASGTGAPSMYLHDTGWPFPGRLDDYVDALGRIFLPATRRSRMISVEACWRTCPGTGKSHEVVLLQKILDWEAFARLLTDGESHAQRGGWMVEGLAYRDRWESKLLRPVAWSPRR